MAAGKCGQRLGGAVEILEQRVDHCAQLEHHGGVNDVLAGRAPVDVAGCLLAALADLGDQRVNQRGCEVARDDGAFRQRCEVVVPGLAGLGDGAGMAGRHDADRSLGARKRGLEVQHPLYAGAVVDHAAHLGGRVEWRQQR